MLPAQATRSIAFIFSLTRGTISRTIRMTSSPSSPTTRTRAVRLVVAAVLVVVGQMTIDERVVKSKSTLKKKSYNDRIHHNAANTNTNITKSSSSSSSSSSAAASSTLDDDNNSSSSLSEETSLLSSVSSSCLESRGIHGHWVQYWDYANRTNYKMHGSYTNWHVASQNFRATTQQPFRLATSWKWQEDSSSDDNDDDKKNVECPIHEISLPGFCQACADLDITRLLILGDSLSIEFMYSILSLLGFPPQGRRTSFNGIQRPFRISCPAGGGSRNSSRNKKQQFFVTLWLFRKSPLEQFVNLGTDSKLAEYVTSNPNRTAIIANTGAWMKDLDDYKLAFHSLLDWLDSFPDSSKIVAFFRPTIPGHVDCSPRGAGGGGGDDGGNNKTKTDEQANRYNWTITVDDAPFLDYQDYWKTNRKNKTAVHNWFNFEAYNAHSQALLQNRTKAAAAVAKAFGRASPFNSSNNNNSSTNQQNTTSIPAAALVPVHWLNVFNSTVLRRDGHVGFDDCLHYYIPGESIYSTTTTTTTSSS
jgi:hypothetical protein